MSDSLVKLATMLVSMLSPELRAFLQDFVNALEEKAKATDNPWDNVGVALLKALLFIK